MKVNFGKCLPPLHFIVMLTISAIPFCHDGSDRKRFINEFLLEATRCMLAAPVPINVRLSLLSLLHTTRDDFSIYGGLWKLALLLGQWTWCGSTANWQTATITWLSLISSALLLTPFNYRYPQAAMFLWLFINCYVVIGWFIKIVSLKVILRLAWKEWKGSILRDALKIRSK